MKSCPTPRKAAYRDRGAAECALHNPGKMVTFLTPHRCYRCRCGKWHLTSKPKQGTKR